MDKLPLYKIVINEDDDLSGIELISLVDKPAIEIKGVAFSKQEFEDHFVGGLKTHPNCSCEIVNGKWVVHPEKSDSGTCELCLKQQKRYNAGRPGSSGFSEMKFIADGDKQIIAGPILIPNKPIYRNSNGYEYNIVFSAEEIDKLVTKLKKKNNNRIISLMHTDKMVDAYIKEDWIIRDSNLDTSRSFGFDLPEGTYFALIKIEDKELWETEVKQKGRFGFSIEGILGHSLVSFIEIEKPEIKLTESDMISYVISDFIEPKPGDTEEEYISKCISKVIKDGTAQDNKQAAAICYNYWNTKRK